METSLTRQEILNRAERVVIKIGSRLLLDLENNGINERFIDNLSQSIAQLKEMGKEIVLVSSGAVGAGMGTLGYEERPKKLENAQACASVGQIKLMHTYEKYFQNLGLHVGQILLSADDFRDRTRYLNICQTIHSLLTHNITPIINENDSVATEEIKVGDNDKLSADVTHFLEADALIIFTDEDGLYDKNPKEHSNAKLISFVDKITPEIEALAGKSGSKVSTGGMKSKLVAIKQATDAGCHCILANGFKFLPHHIFQGQSIGTFFMGSPERVPSKKRWLSFVSKPKGVLVVDHGGINAITQKQSSLLSVGVKEVQGFFSKDDLIEITSEEGEVVARGQTNFNSEDIKRFKGLKSQEIVNIIGTSATEIVHKDKLVII